MWGGKELYLGADAGEPHSQSAHFGGSPGTCSPPAPNRPIFCLYFSSRVKVSLARPGRLVVAPGSWCSFALWVPVPWREPDPGGTWVPGARRARWLAPRLSLTVAGGAGPGEGEGERGAEQRQPGVHPAFAGPRRAPRACGKSPAEGIRRIRSAPTPPGAAEPSVCPGERKAARQCLDPRGTRRFLCLKSPASCHLAPISSPFSHTCSSSRSHCPGHVSKKKKKKKCWEEEEEGE